MRASRAIAASSRALTTRASSSDNRRAGQKTARRGSRGVAGASASDYDALFAWLSASGADVERVGAVQSSGEESAISSGWGVRARRALRRGERAMSVPKTLWITPESAMGDKDIGAALRDGDFELSPWIAVALQLLKERERGAGSKFAAYVKTLPEALDSPLFWSAEELSEIAGTQLLDSAAGYDSYVRGVYEELRGGLFAKYADAFDVNGAFDEASFRWAFGILRSRTMAPCDGANIALIPGLDLINHSSLSTARWKVGGGGGVAGLFGGAGAASAAASVDCDRDYKENDQIYVNYIPDGIDSQFALDFGFVDVVNPSPGYSLTLSIPEDDPNLFDKLDVLETRGLPESPTFVLRPYSDPDRDLRTFLRLLHCRNTDAFLLEALFRQQCWSLLSEPLSRDNEADCCASITDGVAGALGAYATRTTDEEKTFLMTPPSARSGGARREIAVRCRLAEKSALVEAAAFFDVVAASLDRLEYYQERRLRSLNLLNDDGSSTYDPFKETMA